MSVLELVNAGFSAIFDEGGLPSSDIHELFGTTNGMMQPVEMTLQEELPSRDEDEQTIDVFVIGSHGNTHTVRAMNTYTVRELKAAVEEKTGIDAEMMGLIYGGKILDDTSETSLSSLGIFHGSSVFRVLSLRGGGLPGGIDPSGLDPRYDFDFRNVKDDGKKYMRGGHQYHRPYGWKRIAIRVRGRYRGGDEWLGLDGLRTEETPNEWAVSYHGTQVSNARNIVKEGLKPGPRKKFGRGVYSSPSLEMIEKMYSKEFEHEGKKYKMAFQNRVNPKRVTIKSSSETQAGAAYWITQRGDIRPYGILFKEILEDGCKLF